MADAPERIWAVPERNCTVYMSGNSPITAQDGPFTHRLHGAASEYIRADLVEALQAENQRLREALDPDNLAQIIRAVDGGNRLGAGALAEEISAALVITEIDNE